jgi:16S rRNA processing protein RimM
VIEYFKAGKLVAVHGLKGELILKHELGKKTSLKNLETVFIETSKDSFFPWFIEYTKIKSENEIYLKLETVDTREAAAKISQKNIWLAEDDFKKFAAKTAPASLLGYTVFNSGSN